MRRKSYCSQARRLRRTDLPGALAILCAMLWTLAAAAPAAADDAPAWMHALGKARPPHDEKTNAVLLYSEDILNVQGDGKIKRTERRAFKILRPDGRQYGWVKAYFDSQTRITRIHGWCIPGQGKDYEVKDKEAADMALDEIENGVLMSDERVEVLKIPAAEVGSIVGYEIEQENRPYVLQDLWNFQREIPVREAHYT